MENTNWKDKIYKCTRKISDMIPIVIVICFLLTILGQLVGLAIANRLPGESQQMEVFKMYIAPIGVWIVILLAILIPPGNRKMITTIGTKMKGNTPKWALLGLLIGFGMNTFCVVMSLLLKDIALSFNDFSILWFLVLLFAVFVQSSSEEVSMRVYIYEKLRRRYKSPWVAVLGNALMFACLHLANPGVTFMGILQCFLFGLLASILMWKYQSFCGACWLHTAWNFTQSIFWGLPNSGVVVPYSIFKLEAASSGFFFDPSFGVEGSPAASLFMIAVTVLLYIYAVKKGLPEEDLWAEDEQRILAEQRTLAEQAQAAAAEQTETVQEGE